MHRGKMDTSLLSNSESNQTFVDQHFYLDDSIDGFDITMAVLYLIVCIMGLAGNSLVIVAILKLDKVSSSTTVYILNLAIADGLFMVSLPFVASQNFRNHWMFGDMVCKVVMVLDGINQFTSAFCLTAMSVDRYMALADPLLFGRWRTPRCAKIVSVFLWLFSLITILPMALHFTAEQGLCIPDIISDAWWLGILTYTFLTGFALPFMVMTVAYTALLLRLRSKQLRMISPNPESHQMEQQVTKMVVAVVVVFGLCWLPFYTLNFCSLYQSDLVLTFARAFEFVVLLSYSWSCANPILYACLSDNFKLYFRTLLCPAAKKSCGVQYETEWCDLSDTCIQNGNIVA